MKGAVSYFLMQIQNSVSWKINKSDNSYSFTNCCWRSGDKNDHLVTKRISNTVKTAGIP